MEDVVFYLDDMIQFGIPLDFGHYTHLLHGFYVWYGKQPSWDAERLESVFSPIREGVMDGEPPFRITYVLVLAAIRAYGTVNGGLAAREIWELLRPWMAINENVRSESRSKINQLEELVVTFERGEKLDFQKGGGDVRWKVNDWRNTTYSYSG
jgi:hypothetical protein